MDEFELELMLDDEKENEGSAFARKEFTDFLREIDPQPLITTVGILERNSHRFKTEYRAALWFYKRNRRTPRVLPSLQVATRKLKRISKAADTLTFLLKDDYGDKSDIRWFIEETYLLNITDERIESTPEMYEGLAVGESEIQQTIDLTTYLSEMISEAQDILPNGGKGKPKVNFATEELVRRLAVIFTEHSGQPASSGNYWDAVSGQYKGKFTAFVEHTIGHFPQKYPLTNNAIGEIIRRALGSRKGQY